MSSNPRQERGVTLIVVLILLVVLTLLVVSAVNISTANLKIMGHTQSIEINETRAQDAVQQLIGSVSEFKNAAPEKRSIELDSGTGKIDLVAWSAKTSKSIGAVEIPACVWTVPAEGYSATDPLAPEDTVWDVHATVTDPKTDTVVEIHQGVGILMLAGNCK
jgi:hypothetical protein